jgi:hypothetical protein
MTELAGTLAVSVKRLAAPMRNNGYGQYLRSVLRDRVF